MNTLTKRIHRLPLELRLWCIIPYTYQLQNKKLLRDIRTYRTDKNILDNVYGTRYNNYILLHDLKQYCQIPQLPLYIVHDNQDEINNIPIDDLPECFTIWRRYYANQQLDNIELMNKMMLFLTTRINSSTSRKIHFIFGLLTVEERTQFIENFILDEQTI
jgi:hypothetical protein